jgi:chorismate synthase
MASSSFGEIFRLTTFGESHGVAIGGIIDGCPPGLLLNVDFIQSELDRRRPGQNELSSQRNESDRVEFLSGVFENLTTGAPIAFLVTNKDHRPEDYVHLKDLYRPSHADFVYQQKYGIRDYRGGGRSSARETLSRVVAGSVAKLFLQQKGISIIAFVKSIGHLSMDGIDYDVDSKSVESSPVRCPDPLLTNSMQKLIVETKNAGDTLGGEISCVIRGVSPGLGEPVFDKLHADLGKAMLSINAVKGFEIGSGFAGSRMKGSEHNDRFVQQEGKVATLTNHSGGIQGGISNGEVIHFNVGFKPVATLMMDQLSVDKDGNETTIKGKGRHDVCVVPRAVPIVEAMAALVIVDHMLRRQAYIF